MSFIKKNFVRKEKSETVTKEILVTKLRKLSFSLELWYQHYIVIVEITHKIRTCFKTLASRKAAKNLRVTLNFHGK